MASDIKKFAIILTDDVNDNPLDWHIKKTSDDLEVMRATKQVGKTFRIVPRSDFKGKRLEGHTYVTLEGDKVRGAIYEMTPQA